MSSKKIIYAIRPWPTQNTNNTDSSPNAKALVHAKNELQKLRQELHKATQVETGLHVALKKTRANHFRAVAECKRLKDCMENQRFIVSTIKGAFQPNKTSPNNRTIV